MYIAEADPSRYSEPRSYRDRTAAIAYFFFGEELTLLGLAGMLIGVAGVALVVRRSPAPLIEERI